MFRNGLRLILLGVLVCAVAMTGCKKRPKKGGELGAGGDNVGNVMGSDDAFGAGALGERMEGGSEIAGQFSAVYFAYDSAQIDPAERGKLDAVAEHLRGNSAVGLIVEGHCDERGSTEYNLSLGERRALAVRAYLIGLGLDASRIQTKSLGEERPAAMGHDESAWSQNRRAEFVLFQ